MIGDSVNQVIIDQSNAKAFILKIRKDSQEVPYFSLNQAMEQVIAMLTENEIDALAELYILSRHGEEVDFSKKANKIRFLEYLKGYFSGRFFANTKAKLDREVITNGTATN
jgi:hypothetical protein